MPQVAIAAYLRQLASNAELAAESEDLRAQEAVLENIAETVHTYLEAARAGQH